MSCNTSIANFCVVHRFLDLTQVSEALWLSLHKRDGINLLCKEKYSSEWHTSRLSNTQQWCIWHKNRQRWELGMCFQECAPAPQAALACRCLSAECRMLSALTEVASLQLWHCLLCQRLVGRIQLQVSLVQVCVWWNNRYAISLTKAVN